MSCEGQIFSGVQWSLLTDRVADLSSRVAEVANPEPLDATTTRELFRATNRAFAELLVLLEPFVKEIEANPHVADTHRAPVGV